jgi:hypothetical protein
MSLSAFDATALRTAVFNVLSWRFDGRRRDFYATRINTLVNKTEVTSSAASAG